MTRQRPAPSLSRDEERIAAEAADWLTRHTERDRTGDERFEAWIEADPRHLDVYERLARTWDDLGGLGHLRPLAEPDRRFPSLATHVRNWLRPQVLAGAATALAALVIAAIYAPSLLPAPAPDYATSIAELRPIALEDGSVVTLGARSGVDVAFSADRREVTLRDGQAFFEVTRNEARPFLVRAGDVLVQVVGTKFDVRRGQDETVISVLEGIVRVSTDDDAAPRVLHAGEQAVFSHRAGWLTPQPALTEVATIAPSHVAAWRDGRLSYDDALLSEVVADVNRYYGAGVEVRDEAKAIRITGSFRTNEVEGFLSDLGAAFPVNVSQRESGRYVIAARGAR